MGVQVAKCLNQYHFKFHFELHKRKLNNTIKAILKLIKIDAYK